MFRISILLLALWSISGFALAQTRYYVDVNAGGQGNGQSWSDAFIDLHDALALALLGDEIWVAQGEYYPSAIGDRSARFQLTSGVKLYGSFAGTEMLVEERQIGQHPSILSGDIGVTGDSLDNSYTILHLTHPDLGTWVDGFTFRCGQADSPVLPNFQAGTSGAAIFMDGANSIAYPNIQHCVFEHNTARSNGGAVYVDGGGTGSVAPIFKNCRFYQNRSFLGSGGAVYRNGGSWLERPKDVENCVFIENCAARSGGGLYLNDTERSDTANIVGCHFQGNVADICSDAVAWGYTRNTGSHLKIVKSEFRDHHHKGTLMMDVFGSDPPNSEFYAVVDSCIFYNNRLFQASTRTMIGGLRYFSESNWQISNTLIAHNMGDIFFCDETNRGGPHIFRNTELSDNSLGVLFTVASGVIGKNLSIHDNSTFLFFTWLNVIPGVEYSYPFHLANSEVFNNELNSGFTDYRGTDSSSIASCTFSNNLQTGYNLENSSMHIFNSISFNNYYSSTFVNSIKRVPFLFDGLDTLYVYNSSLDTLPISPLHFYGPGSLFSTDPLFTDYQDGNLKLLPCSPLINVGSNAATAGILTDIAGNPRILEGTVDIGAYESPAFALAAEPQVQPACVGSSNGSIIIQPEHGCEPLAYNWSPNAGNGPELNGLPPGDFIFTITDSSGRQLSDTVTVAAAPLPELALAPTNVQCGLQSGGSLTASVTSGTAPFQYQWLPGASDTSSLSQLPPGAYALTVTDAFGCLDSASALIALIGQLTPMIGGQAISCHGAADGWLSLTPLTGAPPFQWQWQGWPGTDSIAQPLGPGQYSVTVTDAFGCTASNTFPYTVEPDSLWIGTGSNAQTQTNPPNGTAVVTTISGGTSPFGYLWEPGGSTEQAIVGLAAGTYTVTVTDKHGCVAVKEVVVELMVGTEEAAELAFLMYPNPAADWVKIVLPARQGLAGGPDASGGYSVELSDASGRVVLQLQTCENGDCTLGLSGLPSGAYILMVKQNGQTVFSSKVIKRR